MYRHMTFYRGGFTFDEGGFTYIYKTEILFMNMHSTTFKICILNYLYTHMHNYDPSIYLSHISKVSYVSDMVLEVSPFLNAKNSY
mgnify:FL=1